MSLSWITRPKPPESVDELVAAGKYGKAVARLREQFSRRYPSTTERQHYAEVLVLAGRGVEAVPVLLGIADEQERYGFPDEALEALERAAEIHPDQAEVKERLASIRHAPTKVPADEAPPPAEDPHAAPDSRGSALDGAFAAQAGPESPEKAAEERPELAVLDAGAPDPPGLGTPPSGPRGGREPAAVEAAGAAAARATQRSGEPDLVVVEVETISPDDGEITARTLHDDPAVAGAAETETTGADEGEITARSLHVDPSVLGPPEAETADDGEITARSLWVDPSVLDATETETTADEGEITARSLFVDPSVLGAAASEAADGDPGEKTAPSLRVDGNVAGRDEPATPTLLLPEEDLEPEPDLELEEVEELTAEDGPEVEPGVADARALLGGDVAGHDHTAEDPEPDLETDAGASFREDDAESEWLRSLVTDEDLEAALTADAQALLAGPPSEDEPGSAEDEGHLDALLGADAQALLAERPASDGPALPGDEGHLDALLATDARALLSDRPRRDGPAPVGVPGDTGEEPGRAAPDLPGEDTGEEETEAPTALPAHPDETLLFLSEEDLFGALEDAPAPPFNGNGNGNGSRANRPQGEGADGAVEDATLREGVEA